MNRRVYEWLAARLAAALLAALMAAGCTREEQTPPIDATETPGSTGASGAEEAKMTPSERAGTNWQLVRIASMDDSVSEPDERSHYTIRFDPDGRAAIRADCNRGNGTWKAEGAKLAFGPIALTRAMWPPR